MQHLLGTISVLILGGAVLTSSQVVFINILFKRVFFIWEGHPLPNEKHYTRQIDLTKFIFSKGQLWYSKHNHLRTGGCRFVIIGDAVCNKVKCDFQELIHTRNRRDFMRFPLRLRF